LYCQAVERFKTKSIREDLIGTLFVYRFTFATAFAAALEAEQQDL
jgi:hypothetical protein